MRPRPARLTNSTFFKPDHLRPHAHAGADWFEQVLQEFEAFWESEAPRIGEFGAKGWLESGDLPPPVSSADRSALPPNSDPFNHWLEAETQAQKFKSRPGRTADLDPEDDDDPFRIVLFDDIQSLLFPIRSPTVRLQLCYTFLHFLDLPFTPPDVPTTASLGEDPHLCGRALIRNDRLRSTFWPAREARRTIPWQTVGGEPMEPEANKRLADPFTCPIRSWAAGRDTFFAQEWFRDIDKDITASLDTELIR